jgi:hypothetical protein
MTADHPKLASLLAIVDNTMGDPDLVTDLLMACLWKFESASSKHLNKVIHFFCQEQSDHDQRVDAIIQDLHANCINPKSFVPPQDFDYRVQSIVKATVDPVQNALCKDLDELKHTYDNILTEFNNSMTASAQVIQLSLSLLVTLVSTHLEKVATTNASMVSHITMVAATVTTMNTRIATVESSLAQVVSTTGLLHDKLKDMGDLISSLAQMAQGFQPPPRAPPVMLSPLGDTLGILCQMDNSPGCASSINAVAGSQGDNTNATMAVPPSNVHHGVHWPSKGLLPHNHESNMDLSSFTLDD